MDEVDEKPLVLLFGCPELNRGLRERGFATSTTRSSRQLFEPKEDLQARAIIIGPEAFRDLAASETLPRLRERWPMVDIVVWAWKASGAQVRDALTAGAKDVLMTKSSETCVREIAKIVEAQQLLPRAARLGDARGERTVFEGMHARSRTMWDLFDTATRVASTEATVLLLGETGTGKELLARAIHRHSGRGGRFVPVNSGGFNEALVDSELFGHVKGAFTGATSDKEGLFRHADKGTLFLDEIGNVPLTAQYHLLRVLQEGAVRPVGGHEEQHIDVRVVAATSNALEEDVQRGRFREDLFYRLDVIRLEIPPLRERPEDVVFLFAHFARKIAQEYNVTRPDLHESFLDALVAYRWPGNVRQLENFTERLVLTHTGQRVDADAFGRLLPFQERQARGLSKQRVSQPVHQTDADIDTSKSLEETLQPQVEALERAYLQACLRACKGRMGAAAKQAGVSRRTLLRKLQQYGLDKRLYRGASQEDDPVSSETH